MKKIAVIVSLMYKQPITIIWLIAALPFTIGCYKAKKDKEGEVASSSFFVDTTLIPKDTVLATASNLKLDNGIYYLENRPFSGYIKEQYPNNTLSLIASYWKGMQHGTTTSYYPNGQLRFVRMYKENKSFGKHFGFWENGKQKFEFYYFNDKREGSNKQWYQSGQPYTFLNFKDDKENGLQQAWRENGKPYINYEAKDGFRYGLQKSGLCYTLKDQKLKTTK
jgi:antitoxin component YwqK of YwqJK toxin-antitoxin module